MRAIDRFLEQYGLLPESISFEEGVNGFLSEMERGLAGEPSSLAMIPAWVSADGDVPEGEKVIVLDAGGTNFRSATFSFSGGAAPGVEHFSKSPMPGTEGPIGREEFFRLIAEKMEASVWDSDKVGFCFSYPTEILPDGDGRLIRFTKEVDAPEVEGALIGRSVNDALEKRYGKDAGGKKITVLNDTVATMLAGKASAGPGRYSGYIGFILGTGTNCAYLERTEKIGTLQAPCGREHMAINMEAGGYAGFGGGEIDKAFFAATDKPDQFHFEKMVSGAYLGPLALAAAKAAGSEGLFSPRLAAFLEAKTGLTTVEMDACLHDPRNSEITLLAACENEEDRKNLYLLFDAVVARAAKLAAVSLAAVVIRTGEGENPTLPVAIVADGTTFYKTWSLADRTRCFLERELTGRYGRYARFLSVENAPAVGAAVAGLLN